MAICMYIILKIWTKGSKSREQACLILLMEKYKVFCCTHIDTQCFNDPLYTLLHTGQEYDGKTIGNMQGDDTGDNISIRKDVFDGFVTGLYWIWKNTNYEYTGLCSYRGYLTYNGNDPLRLEEAEELFENASIDFLASKYEMPMPLFAHFRNMAEFYYFNLHDPFEYLREAVGIIDSGYLKAFDYVYNSNVINIRHTFLTRKKFLNRYCEWVFAVIDRFERILTERHYQILRNRFFGFFIEFLERVWIINNPINILELPIVFVTNQNKGYINEKKNEK